MTIVKYQYYTNSKKITFKTDLTKHIIFLFSVSMYKGQECPVGIALDIMLLGHTVGTGSIPVVHMLSNKRKMQPKSNKNTPSHLTAVPNYESRRQ